MALVQGQVEVQLPFPPEVRNMLYRLLLTSILPIWLDASGIFSFPYDRKKRPKLNILRVSKATLTEALPIFYDSNNFESIRNNALRLFASPRPITRLQISENKQTSKSLGKFKLANIRHLTLGHRWQFNKARIEELKQLKNLTKLTTDAFWSNTWLLGGLPVHCDLSARDESHKDDVEVATGARIVEWLPVGGWSAQFRELMLARPEVKVEVVVEPDPSLTPLSPSLSPRIVALFRVSWDGANGRYVFHYESEQLWSAPK